MELIFRDLKRQYNYLKESVDKAVKEVISAANFISGQQVSDLEEALASYVGVKHCVSCANGTDAISIALMAYNIGIGDAVFVPDFTFFSSGECPAAAGATPIFVDVNRDTYNIDAVSLEQNIEKIIREGKLKPKAVVAVDLFGRPFEYSAICSICERYNLLLLEDAAQGFGGYITISEGKRMACSLGDISVTSFFPAKPFGCYGDGGAIFTDNENIASICRSVAVHGKDMDDPADPYAKYSNVRLGMNSRLDTLQAGILLAKLDAFKNEELESVNHVAELYSEFLAEIPGLVIPAIADGEYSSWAQYTVQLPENVNRENVRISMRNQGIPTNIYYINPMHRQRAFANTRSADAECPVTEELCKKVLCLPIHPYLTDEEVKKVCEALSFCVSRS